MPFFRPDAPHHPLEVFSFGLFLPDLHIRDWLLHRMAMVPMILMLWWPSSFIIRPRHAQHRLNNPWFRLYRGVRLKYLSRLHHSRRQDRRWGVRRLALHGGRFLIGIWRGMRRWGTPGRWGSVRSGLAIVVVKLGVVARPGVAGWAEIAGRAEGVAVVPLREVETPSHGNI